MKQFRVLLTLFALTLGWTNVSAQTWTGSEVGEGKALLYNVGTGMYLTRGNGWNTQASIGSERAAMTVLLENYDGKYKIRTNVNGDGKGFEHLSGGTVYSDQSANKNSTWTFTNVGTQDDPVYNIISADNHGGGADFYLTAEGGESTIVGPGSDGTADNAKWKVYLIEDQQAKVLAVMPNATTENPVDATALIGNPDFSTAIAPTGQPWTMNASNQNLSGGATLTNPVAESWQSAFTLSQTISVPNGYYKLRAQGFIREYTETGTDYPVVYINEASKPFIKMVTETADLGIVSSYFTNGDNGEYYFTDWTDAVTVANKSITVGVKGTRTNSWCAWDNFQLQYLGPIDLTEYANQLAAAVASAEATEGTIPAGAYNAIDAVVTENNRTYDNAEDYTAAIQAINNAVAQYASEAIVAEYNRYKALKVAVEALDDDTSAFTGEATVNTTDADGAVEAATSLGEIQSAFALLRADAVTFLNAIVVNEGKSIDITDIWAVNPGFEEGNTNGWTNSGSIKANAQGNKVFDNTQGNYYAERWHTDGTVNLSQTITGLPAGSYVISAYLYTDTPDGVLFANESKTSFNTSNNYSVNVEVDDNGSINFGASCTLTTSTWICMDGFKIALVGVDHSRYNSIKEAVLAIANDLDITQAEALNASAKKTEDIENAVKALRTALLTYLPNAEIPEVGYIDLTNALIDNPTVRQNTDYWTAEGTPNTSYSWAQVNYEECEFYYQNFDFYQTLNLCKGTFEFGVTGFHRAGNHATYFYAGDDKILIPGVESTVVNTMEAAKTYFDAGNGKVALKFALEGESNNIKIGIVNNDTETDRWTIFRDFTLKYYGSAIDLTPYQEALAAAVAQVTAFEETIPAAAYDQLTNAVNEQNKEYDTVEGYQTATAAVENLIAEAKKLQTSYAAYLTLESEVQALYDVADYEEITEGSHETLGTALSTAKTNIVTATTIDDVNTIAETLKGAGATYAGSANPTGEAKFNLTFMLTNPDVSSFPSRTDRADIPGWYTDQTDGNSQTMTNDAATSEDGTKTHFFEYWSNPAKANNEFALYQKVTLPPGTFDISCYAFAQDQYAGQNSVGVFFYANDTQGSAVSTARLTEASLSFINDAEQEVKIGLKTLTGNTYNWMGIGYMELYKVPANTTEYMINTDGIENAAVVATIDGVEVSKALALKNVTLTVSANDGYIVESVTVSYTEGGETKNVDVANTAEGVYTFQMPAFDVTVNVTTAKLATDAELTALAQALQPTAKLGFDEGDYAPYNNVENLTAAEAEIEKVYAEMEVFGGKATQATVLSATQVISQLNWTANTAEVNAFFDGSFASEYSHEGNVMPIGWHGVGDKDNATNVRLMWNVESNAGLNATSSKQAAFAKYTAEYGTETGYTLPLKAGVYELKFIYGGWNEVATRDIKVYNAENNAVVTPVTITAKDNQAHTTADSWSNYEGTVTIPADGNYVFSFYRENTTNQNQLVFSDITLYKAKAKKGDVNGDGNVDVADVTALVNVLHSVAEKPATADIDGDSDVDIDDVKALVELVLKEE